VWLRTSFAFFFAPKYHRPSNTSAPPANSAPNAASAALFISSARLLNPARPSAQLVGVPARNSAKQWPALLQSLGVRRGMVVCGQAQTPAGPAHLDELSTLGENTVAEFLSGQRVSTVRRSCRRIFRFNPPRCPTSPAAIAWPTLKSSAAFCAATSAARSATRLAEHRRGAVPRRHCRTLLDGWERAKEVIESGLGSRKLDELVERQGRVEALKR